MLRGMDVREKQILLLRPNVPDVRYFLSFFLHPFGSNRGTATRSSLWLPHWVGIIAVSRSVWSNVWSYRRSSGSGHRSGQKKFLLGFSFLPFVVPFLSKKKCRFLGKINLRAKASF